MSLCPNVRPHPNGDRNVFLVKSRSNPAKEWQVDGEAKFGLGQCNCPDATKNKNPSCHHVEAWRKFVTIIAMQGEIRKNQLP